MPNEHGIADDEQRRYWRLRWLSSLQAFADANTQMSKWANPDEINPHFSFVECMCCYFDDADLADPHSYDRRIANGYLTQAEANAVAEFHSMADLYRSPSGDDYDVDSILNDPAWHNVVAAAQRAQARLSPLLKTANELSALTNPSVWETVNGTFRGKYPDPV